MASSSSKKRRDGRLNIRLTHELKQAIELYAERNHMTVTGVLVLAVMKLLREEPK